jgi:hypothetical protein
LPLQYPLNKKLYSIEDTEQEWGDQAKAETFEEFAQYVEADQYAVPISALIYDPFQSVSL